MGEAKRRGSREARQEQAVSILRNRLPDSVSCNNCKTELSEIQPMDVRGMQGMHSAGAAHCEVCQHETWVLDGTPEGLSLFREFLDGQHGAHAVSTGFALKK